MCCHALCPRGGPASPELGGLFCSGPPPPRSASLFDCHSESLPNMSGRPSGGKGAERVCE